MWSWVKRISGVSRIPVKSYSRYSKTIKTFLGISPCSVSPDNTKNQEVSASRDSYDTRQTQQTNPRTQECRTSFIRSKQSGAKSADRSVIETGGSVSAVRTARKLVDKQLKQRAKLSSAMDGENTHKSLAKEKQNPGTTHPLK